MGASAFSGPIFVFGAAQFGDTNPEAGPSGFYGGAGILDPRGPFTYEPGQNQGSATLILPGMTRIPVVDQVPSALAAANIVAAAPATSGTKLTLVSATGAGITAGVTITNSATNQPVTGLLAIDGAMTPLQIGITSAVWDPTKAIARNVRITSVGNDSTGNFLVAGYDLYGYPMSEQITGANAGVASGKKAFKYIASVTPGGTISGSNVSVGTGDVYGLPIRADQYPYTEVYWNNAVVILSTFVAADTSTALPTTGDVRGTIAVATPSNGTIRMVAFVTPSAANVATATGLFGSAQA